MAKRMLTARHNGMALCLWLLQLETADLEIPDFNFYCSGMELHKRWMELLCVSLLLLIERPFRL